MRPSLRIAVAVLACLLAAGCGGAGGDGPEWPGGQPMGPADPPPPGRAQDFPPARGRSLPDITATLPDGPELAPSVSVLERGRNRVGFALYDTASKQLSGAAVALYVGDPDGARARGPYVARSVSLAVPAQFHTTTAEAPDTVRSVYVAEVPVHRSGPIQVVAIAKLDGRLVATRSSRLVVAAADRGGPEVGDRAPVVHTAIAAGTAGAASWAEARRPATAALHANDLADVLGRKPVVLLFAAASPCRSRVCAPVLDVAVQLQAELGDRVAVIHQEVDGGGAAIKAYNPPSAPWTFVIGRDGRIAARFGGAVSVAELRAAVEGAV